MDKSQNRLKKHIMRERTTEYVNQSGHNCLLDRLLRKTDSWYGETPPQKVKLEKKKKNMWSLSLRTGIGRHWDASWVGPNALSSHIFQTKEESTRQDNNKKNSESNKHSNFEIGILVQGWSRTIKRFREKIFPSSINSPVISVLWCCTRTEASCGLLNPEILHGTNECKTLWTKVLKHPKGKKGEK